jgi:hypothetical protein
LGAIAAVRRRGTGYNIYGSPVAGHEADVKTRPRPRKTLRPRQRHCGTGWGTARSIGERSADRGGTKERILGPRQHHHKQIGLGVLVRLCDVGCGSGIKGASISPRLLLYPTTTIITIAITITTTNPLDNEQRDRRIAVQRPSCIQNSGLATAAARLSPSAY